MDSAVLEARKAHWKPIKNETSNKWLRRYALLVCSIFGRNRFGTSLIIDFAISKDKETLLMITKNEVSIKPYTLTKVTYENNFFIHTSLGSFFSRR